MTLGNGGGIEIQFVADTDAWCGYTLIVINYEKLFWIKYQLLRSGNFNQILMSHLSANRFILRSNI